MKSPYPYINRMVILIYMVKILQHKIYSYFNSKRQYQYTVLIKL